MKNKRLFIEVCVLIGVIILVLIANIQNKKKISITSQEENFIAQEKESPIAQEKESADGSEYITDRYKQIMQEVEDELVRGTKSKQEIIVLLQEELNKVFDVENTQAMTKRVEEGKIDREKVKKYEELQTIEYEIIQFQLPGDSKDYEQKILDLENGKALNVINSKEDFKIIVMPKYKAPTFQDLIDESEESGAQIYKTYVVNTYGEEVLNSGYMYQKIIENSVMQDINSDMSLEEIVFFPTLLICKYVTLVNGTMDQGSISFEDEYIKAMQTGRGNTMGLKIYDNKGDVYLIMIHGKEADYGELINCILATTRIE